jgi:hypothetical protein
MLNNFSEAHIHEYDSKTKFKRLNVILNSQNIAPTYMLKLDIDNKVVI